MEKHLVTIEFRYKDAPKTDDDLTSKDKIITIGVYDDFDEACKHGNELIEKLERKFNLHTFPNGSQAKKERFSSNGGCFGGKKTLITDLAYLKTPFSFYAKITKLNYDVIDIVIDDVVNASKRYIEYKKLLQESE